MSMMSASRMIMCGRGRYASFAAAALGAAAVACTASSEPAPAGPVHGSHVEILDDIDLENPTSVLYDAAGDVYLVANAGASGSAFITRLSPRGRVRDGRFIDGRDRSVELHSPGGMSIRGDTLYIADRECIRRFHRVSGAPAGSVCPRGAVALNDVTVDARRRLYFSDAGTGIVHVMDANSAMTVMLRDPILEQNGGLSAGRSGVLVASSAVYQLRPEGPWPVLRDRGSRLGGIVFTNDGSFAFSNPEDSSVVFVQLVEKGTRGDVWTLVTGISSPGDLGYDSRRERILVPQADHNSLMVVSLAL